MFVSPWMLFWGLAVLIPITIHFLIRQRKVRVSWGAMRLVRQATLRSQRPFKLWQFLLLLLRTVSLGLLAMAVAQPLGCRPPTPSFQERTLHLLVLDGSYSMNIEVKGQSNWDRAVAQAKDLCRHGNEGDGFLLMFAGITPRTILAEPHSEPASVMEALERLKSTEGSVSFTEVLAVAADLLDQTLRDHPEFSKAQTTIWSDGQRRSWPITSSRFASQMKRLAELGTIDLRDLSSAAAVNFGWTDFADPTGSFDQPDAGQRDHQRTGELTARLTNHSDREIAGAKVRLLEQGSVRDSKRVSLPPHQSILMEFTPVLDEGEHLMTVEVTGDQLATDNWRHLIVRTRQRYRVAVVGEKKHTQLLGAALEPSTRRGPPSNMQIVELELGSFLNDQGSWDARILCDLDRPGRRMMERIEAEVGQGHPLIVWLGPRANPNDYDRWIESFPKSSPPARFRSIVQQSTYALDPLEYAHPILRDFAGYPDAGLVTAPIFRYWRLEEVRSGSEVVISTTTGEPIILANRNGHLGPLLLVAIPPYLDLQRGQTSSISDFSAWSGLPAWPGFPPLVHSLVAWGVQAHQHEATLVGQRVPGLQHIPEKSGFYPYSDGGTKRMIAVNVDPEEGSLDRVRSEEILGLIADIEPFARESSTKTMLVGSANGYRYALAGMMLALILETCLARRKWFTHVEGRAH